MELTRDKELKSNGDFPLAAPEKVALYGSGARRTILGKR